jgi:excisionase family DNA binding protein
MDDQSAAATSSQRREERTPTSTNPDSESRPLGVAAGRQGIADVFMNLVAVFERFADGTLHLLTELVKLAERHVESNEDQNRTVVQALPPEALSFKDAARLMGMNVATVEHLTRNGKLPFVQHGSQRGRVIRVEDCRKFLSENRREMGEKAVTKNQHA